jgi:hypothetical protein
MSELVELVACPGVLLRPLGQTRHLSSAPEGDRAVTASTHLGEARLSRRRRRPDARQTPDARHVEPDFAGSSAPGTKP